MTTTPPPMPEAKQTPLLDLLQDIPTNACMSYEISQFHHRSIPVGRLCAEAVERITALEADRAMLREALKGLLDDTQHAEHPDCEDGPCPVRAARAAMENTK